MHFNAEQSQALLSYLSAEFGPICDADPSVLGNYCLALLKHNTELEELRANCTESLTEFLGVGETEPFVMRLFAALESGSYLDFEDDDSVAIEYVQEDQDLLQEEYDPYGYDGYEEPYIEESNTGLEVEMVPRNEIAREERKIYSRDRDQDRDRDDRRDNRDGGRRFCYQFKEKGYCLKGDDCRYEHVSRDSRDSYTTKDIRESRDRRISREENSRDRSPERSRGRDRDRSVGRDDSFRSRGGGRGGRGRGRGGAFGSRVHSIGSQKVLVVQQIPEDFCDESKIREYFSKFGTLSSLSVDVYGGSAKIEYETHEQAQSCNNSPDVIFNNRFVKVFWSDAETAPLKLLERKANEPPQPVLTPEELQANLDRHKERKKEMELIAIEKQKVLAAMQKTRTELISKQMQEQTHVMERLRGTTLTVEERTVLMKGLSLLQDSIKGLMTASTSSNGISLARPTYRPPFRPKTSQRQFAMVPVVPMNDGLDDKREALSILQEQKLGDKVAPAVLARMATLQAEIYPTHANPTAAVPIGLQLVPGRRSMKLDLRQKPVLATDAPMEPEDQVMG